MTLTAHASRPWTVSVALASLAIAATPTWGQDTAATVAAPATGAQREPELHDFAEELERTVPELMRLCDVDTLGIAVVEAGEVVWEHDFTRVEAGDERTYEARSLAEPILAWALLGLEARGELDLDASLRGADLPRALRDHPFAARVTARHLLHHTSGLVPVGSGATLGFVGAPGERFVHAPAGTALLVELVERRLDLSVSELAEREVLEPLGMHGSTLLRDAERTRDGRRALGARRGIRLRTTPGDYARFVDAVITGSDLRADTLRRLLARGVPIAPSVHWGTGIGLQQRSSEDDVWVWCDTGVTSGFAVGSSGAAHGERAVVYLADGAQGIRLARAIVGPILGRDQPAIDWLDETFDLGIQPWPWSATHLRLERALAERGGAGLLEVARRLLKERRPAFDARLWTGWAERLANDGEPTSALALLRHAARSFPTSAEVQRALGQAHLDLGQRNQAISCFRRSLALDPGDDSLRRQLRDLEKHRPRTPE